MFGVRCAYACCYSLRRWSPICCRHLSRVDGCLVKIDGQLDPLRRRLFLNIAKSDLPVGVARRIGGGAPLRENHPCLEGGPVKAQSGACRIVSHLIDQICVRWVTLGRENTGERVVAAYQQPLEAGTEGHDTDER